MKWGVQKWDDHGRIHFPTNEPWGVQVTKTLSNLARYSDQLSDADIESLEMGAVAFRRDAHGQIVLTNPRSFPRYPNSFHQIFLVFDEAIGASDGKETDIVLVQWDPEPDGTVHGHPITEQDLKNKISGKPAAKEAYRKIRDAMKTERFRP